ncbi:hypothetical protein [Thauera sp. Sel9]|uniref:hypothetical protein n=1 Tax=Thauera sp. Sel9 TaxID=2974299 RepID=UPI0021E12C17|nr:hypothetical protein [Thauera sp. Sel9]MCV2219303.1 hypothetical protein [Thauera sp. Sel9]
MSIELSNRRRLVWDWSNFLHNDLRLSIIDTLTDAELCALEGHADWVRGALELRDGRLLTWSSDQTLRIWRMSDGACETVFRAHRAWICGALEAAPGIILSWDGDGWLHRWSTATGESRNTLAPLEGPSIHDTGFRDILAAGSDRLLTVHECQARLIDTADLTVIRTCEWASDESGFCSLKAGYLPPAHFLIHDHDRAIVHSLEDGHPVTVFKLRGHETKVLPLCDGRLLFLHWSHRTKRHVIDLRELPPAGRITSKLIATLEFDGERVEHVVEQADGEVLLAFKDYRAFLLGTQPLALRREAALAPDGSSGFLSFDPEVAERAELLADGPRDRRALRAHWLGATETGFMALPPNRHPAGEPVRDGRLLLEADGGFELFDLRSGTCEEIPAVAREAVAHRALDRGACNWAAVNGRSDGVSWRMARLTGVAPEAVTEAIAPLGELHQEGRQRLWLVPAEGGAIVGWQRGPEPAAWWIDRKAGGDSVEVLPISIDATQFEAFNGCPLIAPDGTVHALRGGRLAPLTRPDRNDTLRVLPAYRDQLPFLRWCAGNRILARDFDGVAVHDATSLKWITRLDGGHGVAIRGIHELRDGTLVIYSRSALRSWRTADLAPLVELKDPEDWGPGCETLVSLRHMTGLAFCVGKYSMDSRVVLWDGATQLLVLGAHTEEVVSIMELGDGYMASWCEDRRKGDAWHIWRIPQALWFDR